MPAWVWRVMVVLNPELGWSLLNLCGELENDDIPDMYWDISSRPMAAPFGPCGSHKDFTGIL